MNRMLRLPLLLLAIAASTLLSAQPVPRTQCFALESLPPDQRAESDALLLRTLDSEALYTVITGLKPMSGSFLSHQLDVAKPDLARVEKLRQLMAPWHCGSTLQFDFHHLARAFEIGKPKEPRVVRFMEGVVVHRPRLAETIQAHPELFSVYGITPSANPAEVLLAIEYNETPDRYRGLGTLYGYPRAAVEFFALNTPISQARSADPAKPAPAAESEAKPAKRRFVNIPTFGREKGGFVYAVAAEAEETDEDRTLRAKALPILEEYRRRRALFIGEGKAGAAALLRDWFCRADNDCSPTYAAVTAPAQ